MHFLAGCLCRIRKKLLWITSKDFDLRDQIMLSFFLMAKMPPVGHGRLITEASRSHSVTPHSVRLLWTSDQPDVETSTWQHTSLTTDIHNLSGIRTHNPSKRADADQALDRAATGIGFIFINREKMGLCLERKGKSPLCRPQESIRLLRRSDAPHYHWTRYDHQSRYGNAICNKLLVH